MIYIGTSAGSVVVSSRLHDYLIEEDDISKIDGRTGFGLVNFGIMPHWGSPSFREKYLDGRLKMAYKENFPATLLLSDNQYVHVKDDCIEIVMSDEG